MTMAAVSWYFLIMAINVYAVLTPLLLLLIAGEFLYCLWKKNGYYNFQDSLANLGTAVANQVTNVGIGWAVFVCYGFLYRHFAPFQAPTSTLGFLALFVLVDFLFYWFHRAGHTINILWAAHSPHHSSEELNYTVGARASVTQRAASLIFYAPLALLGWPPETLIPAIAAHHILQFWPHTRAITRLPAWFERYFNAPTHHRVHHGINDLYLDKNYGGVLIIWDKLFGTFAPETEEVRYGLRHQVRTWDAVEINFAYYQELWARAKAYPRWTDKVLIWFMPLGWEAGGAQPPAGALKPEPKYQREVPWEVKAYITAQLVPTIAVMLLVTEHDSPLSAEQKLILGAMICAGTIAWGAMLEAKSWAKPLEAARLAATVFCLAGWRVLA